jgi:hypothetical protein
MTGQLAGALILAVAIVVLAAVLAAAIIVLAKHRARSESGLGSDEEWVRELLGYQASHWPLSNGHRDDETPVT